MPDSNRLTELTLNDLELWGVELYFEKHPNENKCSKYQINPYNGKPFSGSYLREPDGSSFRIASKKDKIYVLGRGASGKVKGAGEHWVVKIQSIQSNEAMLNARAEAAINLDLGLATGPLIERSVGDSTYTVYQRMHYGGVPLSNTIQTERNMLYNSDAEIKAQALKEIDRAIELCLLVDNLHQGKLSKKQVAYAHRDIKPDNILVDARGHLHLIDFGSATDQIAESNFLGQRQQFNGTLAYSAIDAEHLVKKGQPHYLVGMGRNALIRQRDADGKPFAMDDASQDRIALLRVLDHPFDTLHPSLLSPTTRNQLPKPLLDLLDTHQISPHLDVARRHETERFFAAALILSKQLDNSLTKEALDTLRVNPHEQNQLIAQHLANLNAESQKQDLPSAVQKERSDLEKAADFFEKHPEQTKYSRKVSHLPVSYFKDPNGNIFSVANKASENHTKGSGASGRVKGAENNTVVKIQWIDSLKKLEKVRQEADINIDLGVATRGLIERVFLNEDNHLVWKVVQQMHFLGERLSESIAKTDSAANSAQENLHREVDQAIQLCELVHQLHSGALSNNQVPYAHHDLKLDNVLVDSHGQLHLIDFGETTTNLSEDAFDENFRATGTWYALPIDAEILRTGKPGHVTPPIRTFVQGIDSQKLQISLQTQDTIAMLRMLSLPLGFEAVPSVLSAESYALLPEALQDILSTETIAPHLTPNKQNEVETPLFFASLLIAYRNNGYAITDDEIQSLRQDRPRQIQLLQQNSCSRLQLSLDSLHSSTTSTAELSPAPSISDSETSSGSINVTAQDDVGNKSLHLALQKHIKTQVAQLRTENGEEGEGEGEGITTVGNHT